MRKAGFFCLALLVLLWSTGVGATITHQHSEAPAPYVEVLRAGEAPFQASEADLQVLFFDIGVGDAILLSCGGESMLVDFGTRDRSLEALPSLEALGLSRIDYLFNTHAHDDHIEGLMRLIQQDWPIGAYLSHHPADSIIPRHRETMKLLTDKAIPFRQLQVGDELMLGGARIRFFRLTKYNEISMPLNISSMLCRVDYGKNSLLLTADLTPYGEREVLEAFPELLPADILKACHHGYNHMSSAFLGKVAPQLVIVTNLRGSVPGSEQQLKRLGLPRYYLGGGNIHLRSNGEQWYVWREPVLR